jgi:hypothetical protein
MNCKPRDIVIRRVTYRGCPIEAAHRLADHLLPEIERRWGTDAADLQPIAIDIPSNNSLSQQTTTAFGLEGGIEYWSRAFPNILTRWKGNIFNGV